VLGMDYRRVRLTKEFKKKMAESDVLNKTFLSAMECAFMD
jgi:hypothetical protein